MTAKDAFPPDDAGSVGAVWFKEWNHDKKCQLKMDGKDEGKIRRNTVQ
ncbi:MAG: hypothetical protein Q4D60_10690 [Eubacteriales bacterium]|nr:hypothetical protein [Eubacteriales bacterium]